MTIVLGLTGSIGMGKSTTAAMFRDMGVPVFDADATVHALYQNEAVDTIEKHFPGTATPQGIDRKKLGAYVIGQPEKMRLLESIIHPMVQKKRQDFILFKTKAETLCDKVIVVTAQPEVQKKRVLERGTMSEEQFMAILAKQYPDQDKRLRADHLIETDFGLEQARAQVKSLVELYQDKAGTV